MKPLECVDFMLIRNGQILAERRKLTKPLDPGAISIPGGHMDDGESMEETLVREMREELNVAPVDFHYLCSLLHRSQEFDLIHFFVVESWDGSIENHEAEELLWIDLEAPEMFDLSVDRVAVSEYFRLHR